MRNKKFYKEQFRTVVLFSRFCFFSMSYTGDNKKDNDLDDRIHKILSDNKLYANPNLGFIYRRSLYDLRHQFFAPILWFIGFTRACPLWNIPGCYDVWSAKSRKLYQKWCKAFDGQFSDEEITYIENKVIKAGDEKYSFAVETWNNMQNERSWTWSSEFKRLLIYWYLKLTRKIWNLVNTKNKFTIKYILL